MTEEKEEKTFTLGKIQEILDTPQHTLIHLCEKGVIVPDFSDAEGRGKSRRFSMRNLVEFAVVLHIRKFQIPVLTTRAIMIVLKKIEDRVQKDVPNFSILDMGRKDHPQLTAYVEAEANLIFSVFFPGENRSMHIKCAVPSFTQVLTRKKGVRFVVLKELPDTYAARLEINISKIMEDLHKKLLK